MIWEKKGDEVNTDAARACASADFLHGRIQSRHVLENTSGSETVDALGFEWQRTEVGNDVHTFIVDRIKRNDIVVDAIVAGSEVDNELCRRFAVVPNRLGIVERIGWSNELDADAVIAASEEPFEPPLEAIQMVIAGRRLDKIDLAVTQGVAGGTLTASERVWSTGEIGKAGWASKGRSNTSQARPLGNIGFDALYGGCVRATRVFRSASWAR